VIYLQRCRTQRSGGERILNRPFHVPSRAWPSPSNKICGGPELQKIYCG